MTLERLALFLLLFSLSVAMTWIARLVSLRIGFVAKPRADRWHSKPTALLGGPALYLSFMIGFLVFVPVGRQELILVGCATAMFALGFIDDLIHIKPQTKLAGQIVICIALLLSGATLRFSENEVITFLISLLWLVGITNAMNLLDNMDGLCAGIALIASAFRVAFCAIEGDSSGLLIALVFMAGVAGYLVFNFHPASIFMGDSGSLFVGFMLAGMTAGTHPYSRNIASVLLFPVLILIIPIFDTVLVTLARKFSGRAVSVGGLDHSSHRLVATGLSEKQAVLILYAIASTSGLIAYAYYVYGFSLTVHLISLFVIALILFGVYLSRIEVYGSLQEIDPKERNFFQLVADFPYKRFVLLVFFDLLLTLTAYYGAYRLRFEDLRPDDPDFARFMESFPIILGAAVLSFLFSGLYRHTWRYTSLRDLVAIGKATSATVVGSILILTYAYRFAGYSRSLFVIFGALLVLLLAATRLSFRLLSEFLGGQAADRRRVLIYGAGDGGVLLLREMRNNPGLRSRVIGFLDDDPSRLKVKIHGVPILGNVRSADFWIRKYRIEQVIISSDKIPASKVAALQAHCHALGVPVVRGIMRFEPLPAERTG